MSTHQLSQHTDLAQLARKLFPEIAAQITTSVSSPQQAAKQHAERWLSQRTDELLRTPETGTDDRELSTTVLASLTHAHAIFAPIELTVPDAAQFATEGLRLDALSNSPAEHPELLAIPAPHGLGMTAWHTLFARATIGNDHAISLSLASELQRWFDAVDRAPSAACPRSTVTHHADGHLRTLTWTLRMIPCKAHPELMGVPHRYEPHPTLPEMLTMQLLRLATQRKLVDQYTFTWLDAELPDSRLAARHTYDASTQCIRISTRERTEQGAHIGARQPQI